MNFDNVWLGKDYDNQMSQKRKKKIRLGDVYAIPLPNGKFAFGRIFKDACLGIYKYIGNSISLYWAWDFCCKVRTPSDAYSTSLGVFI